MTFATRMQHKIYWGPLKRPIEWSLKTVLAPWAYIASVIYHDSFWYPLQARPHDAGGARQRVGPPVPELGDAAPDADGYPDVGGDGAVIERTGLKAFTESIGILGTCMKEAPEFANRRRKVIAAPREVH